MAISAHSRVILLFHLLAVLLLCPAGKVDAAPVEKTWRIMPVGDSITEGGASFSIYRYPLWEKLLAAGYKVEYVGSKTCKSRHGELHHEGYGGKNAEFLATVVGANFRRYPADILLIHAGHNHDAGENPVPGILAATEKIITDCRAVNPKLIVLLAKVIPSAKLPKYAYIPELNQGLAKLAARLNAPAQPVILVDQAGGFDPVADTVADRVHPNARGAEKMAAKWFSALAAVLGPPPIGQKPEIFTYKKNPKGDLTLHVFKPAGNPSGKPKPAIVFFFGGGWKHGTPLQFYPECVHYAALGLVAISVDYRVAATHGSSPIEAVMDAKSALRWVRGHAAGLGVDPARIYAAGASAGGHLAAATAMLPGLDDPADDLAVSARPNALLLWYPVLDNGPDGYGEADVKARFKEFSPFHNVSAAAPPTLVFLGTRDKLVPVATVKEFQNRMRAAGVRCEVELYEGAEHPIYKYLDGASPLRDQILKQADAFIRSLL